ncbi:MAG: hypothetical protein WCL07_03210 [bacterium]
MANSDKTYVKIFPVVDQVIGTIQTLLNGPLSILPTSNYYSAATTQKDTLLQLATNLDSDTALQNKDQNLNFSQLAISQMSAAAQTTAYIDKTQEVYGSNTGLDRIYFDTINRVSLVASGWTSFKDWTTSPGSDQSSLGSMVSSLNGDSNRFKSTSLNYFNISANNNSTIGSRLIATTGMAIDPVVMAADLIPIGRGITSAAGLSSEKILAKTTALAAEKTASNQLASAGLKSFDIVVNKVVLGGLAEDGVKFLAKSPTTTLVANAVRGISSGISRVTGLDLLSKGIGNGIKSGISTSFDFAAKFSKDFQPTTLANTLLKQSKPGEEALLLKLTKEEILAKAGDARALFKGSDDAFVASTQKQIIDRLLASTKGEITDAFLVKTNQKLVDQFIADHGGNAYTNDEILDIVTKIMKANTDGKYADPKVVSELLSNLKGVNEALSLAKKSGVTVALSNNASARKYLTAYAELTKALEGGAAKSAAEAAKLITDNPSLANQFSYFLKNSGSPLLKENLAKMSAADLTKALQKEGYNAAKIQEVALANRNNIVPEKASLWSSVTDYQGKGLTSIGYSNEESKAIVAITKNNGIIASGNKLAFAEGFQSTPAEEALLKRLNAQMENLSIAYQKANPAWNMRDEQVSAYLNILDKMSNTTDASVRRLLINPTTGGGKNTVLTPLATLFELEQGNNFISAVAKNQLNDQAKIIQTLGSFFGDHETLVLRPNTAGQYEIFDLAGNQIPFEKLQSLLDQTNVPSWQVWRSKSPTFNILTDHDSFGFLFDEAQKYSKGLGTSQPEIAGLMSNFFSRKPAGWVDEIGTVGGHWMSSYGKSYTIATLPTEFSNGLKNGQEAIDIYQASKNSNLITATNNGDLKPIFNSGKNVLEPLEDSRQIQLVGESLDFAQSGLSKEAKDIISPIRTSVGDFDSFIRSTDLDFLAKTNGNPKLAQELSQAAAQARNYRDAVSAQLQIHALTAADDYTIEAGLIKLAKSKTITGQQYSDVMQALALQDVGGAKLGLSLCTASLTTPSLIASNLKLNILGATACLLPLAQLNVNPTSLTVSVEDIFNSLGATYLTDATTGIPTAKYGFTTLGQDVELSLPNAVKTGQSITELTTQASDAAITTMRKNEMALVADAGSGKMSQTSLDTTAQELILKTNNQMGKDETLYVALMNGDGKNQLIKVEKGVTSLDLSIAGKSYNTPEDLYEAALKLKNEQADNIINRVLAINQDRTRGVNFKPLATDPPKDVISHISLLGDIETLNVDVARQTAGRLRGYSATPPYDLFVISKTTLTPEQALTQIKLNSSVLEADLSFSRSLETITQFTTDNLVKDLQKLGKNNKPLLEELTAYDHQLQTVGSNIHNTPRFVDSEEALLNEYLLSRNRLDNLLKRAEQLGVKSFDLEPLRKSYGLVDPALTATDFASAKVGTRIAGDTTANLNEKVVAILNKVDTQPLPERYAYGAPSATYTQQQVSIPTTSVSTLPALPTSLNPSSVVNRFNPFSGINTLTRAVTSKGLAITPNVAAHVVNLLPKATTAERLALATNILAPTNNFTHIALSNINITTSTGSQSLGALVDTNHTIYIETPTDQIYITKANENTTNPENIYQVTTINKDTKAQSVHTRTSLTNIEEKDLPDYDILNTNDVFVTITTNDNTNVTPITSLGDLVAANQPEARLATHYSAIPPAPPVTVDITNNIQSNLAIRWQNNIQSVDFTKVTSPLNLTLQQHLDRGDIITLNSPDGTFYYHKESDLYITNAPGGQAYQSTNTENLSEKHFPTAQDLQTKDGYSITIADSDTVNLIPATPLISMFPLQTQVVPQVALNLNNFPALQAPIIQQINKAIASIPANISNWLKNFLLPKSLPVTPSTPVIYWGGVAITPLTPAEQLAGHAGIRQYGYLDLNTLTINGFTLQNLAEGDTISIQSVAGTTTHTRVADKNGVKQFKTTHPNNSINITNQKQLEEKYLPTVKDILPGSHTITVIHGGVTTSKDLFEEIVSAVVTPITRTPWQQFTDRFLGRTINFISPTSPSSPIDNSISATIQSHTQQELTAEAEFIQSRSKNNPKLQTIYDDTSSNYSSFVNNTQAYVGTQPISTAQRFITSVPFLNSVNQTTISIINKDAHVEASRLFDNKYKRINPIKQKILDGYIDQFLGLVLQATKDGDIKNLSYSDLSSLMFDNIHVLAYQDYVDTENLLGDHGLRHLVDNNITVTFKILDLAKQNGVAIKAIDYLMGMQIQIMHDSGYTNDTLRSGVNASVRNIDVGHNVLSAKNFRESLTNPTNPLLTVFNANQLDLIHKGILWHDDSFINLQGSKDDVILSAIHIADNTHAFETKLPEILYGYPESLKAMRILKSIGDLMTDINDPERARIIAEIKFNLAQSIRNRNDLGEDDKASLLLAVNLLSPEQATFNIGRIFGNNPTISYNPNTNKVEIKVETSDIHTQITKLFNIQAFDQVAKFIADLTGTNKTDVILAIQAGQLEFGNDKLSIKAVVDPQEVTSGLTDYERNLVQLLSSDVAFNAYQTSDRDDIIVINDLTQYLASHPDDQISQNTILQTKQDRLNLLLKYVNEKTNLTPAPTSNNFQELKHHSGVNIYGFLDLDTFSFNGSSLSQITIGGVIAITTNNKLPYTTYHKKIGPNQWETTYSYKSSINTTNQKQLEEKYLPTANDITNGSHTIAITHNSNNLTKTRDLFLSITDPIVSLTRSNQVNWLDLIFNDFTTNLALDPKTFNMFTSSLVPLSPILINTQLTQQTLISTQLSFQYLVYSINQFIHNFPTKP